MTLRLGWFTTARGPGSRGMFKAVSNAIEHGDLDAEFAVLFCNRERGESDATDRFFDLVEERGVPLVTRSSVAYRRTVGGERSRSGEALPAWRAEYDRLVDTDLAEHLFDMGVLAGYMLIFEREFVQHHTLLNLHPALPDGPTGTWQQVIRALIRTRASESGIMTHQAIAEVDMGPPVAFCRYSLRTVALAPLWADLENRIDTLDDTAMDDTPLFAAIRSEGLRREAPFLVAALAACASGQVRVTEGSPPRPVDVTAAVEAALVGSPAPR